MSEKNAFEQKIRSLASGFLFICCILALMFCFLFDFSSDFFLDGFPNPFIVHSRSSFCLVNESSFISSSRLRYHVTTISDLLCFHSFMQFELNCVREVISHS